MVKSIEFNEENVIINVKREKRMKALKAAVCLLAGIFSVWFIQSVHFFNFYRDMANNVMLFVLGIVLVYCGSGVLFAFVKCTPKRNALFCGALSLVLAAALYLSHIRAAYEGSWPGLENNWTASCIVVGIFHLVYAAVIFGGVVLINHFGKKISLKKQNAYANS